MAVQSVFDPIRGVSLGPSSPDRNQRVSSLRTVLLGDPILLVTTLILLGFGLMMVYSTTGILSQEKFGDALYYVKRQSIGVGIGLIVMMLCSQIQPAMIKRASAYLLPICLLLLLLPLIPGIGGASGGARRWVVLPFVRFQPGEFVKLFFIIFMAGFLSRHEGKLACFSQGVVKPLALVSPVALLFLMQPDFGSTAVVVGITLCMAAATGVRLRDLLLALLFVAVCFGILVLISPYRMQRMLSYRSPWADASGKGYQLIQSLIAVGTGQVSGVGLGGSQQKLFFLPAAHTDFIFAVVGEELGFIGCVALLAAFVFFLWRGFALAARLTENCFEFALTVGLTLLVVLPALLNVGVVIGLLPTKGMVLPLVGYGSSSLIASMAGVGLLLGLAHARYRQVN